MSTKLKRYSDAELLKDGFEVYYESGNQIHIKVPKKLLDNRHLDGEYYNFLNQKLKAINRLAKAVAKEAKLELRKKK